MPMPITLQPEHERLIAEALRSGAYQGPGEVIQRALELLRNRRRPATERTRLSVNSGQISPPCGGSFGELRYVVFFFHGWLAVGYMTAPAWRACRHLCALP